MCTYPNIHVTSGIKLLPDSTWRGRSRGAYTCDGGITNGDWKSRDTKGYTCEDNDLYGGYRVGKDVMQKYTPVTVIFCRRSSVN
jgi:hypothetical protein